MNLILIRHGLTDWNLEGRFQGRFDVPLNERGRLQAEALRDRFANTVFDTIYSSPLQRALETARIIVENDGPITVDWRLAEIDHGSWQGKTKDEIGKRNPGLSPEDGESYEQVFSRVNEFLAQVVKDLSMKEEGSILCVSHGVIIQTMCSILLGTQQPIPENASVHLFTFRRNEFLSYNVEQIGDRIETESLPGQRSSPTLAAIKPSLV